MDVSVHQAASNLRTAAENNKPCPPLRKIIGDSDISRAYSVQALNHQHLVANGFQVIGKKIGLTSRAVQNQLGVNQPDFGVLFDFMQLPNESSINYAELMQPKAEAEIAFVMKKDLDGEITMDDIISSIDYGIVAIEIVGSRIENWDIRITDTVADNAAASHFVLGNDKVSLEEIDLEGCKMKLFRNGEMVSTGVGSECLGNPLNALLWLAQTMAEYGQPLKKGEIILSGALGPLTVFNRGDQLSATISGLGQVEFSCI